ncbi:MAG: hypothetical protein HYZ42_02000 [Bacteroidetes bacterium]|nr:hypothetical protein [Bacteroidota bacterium]
MKFVHYLSKTENVEWLGTSAFILFFVIFLVIIIQAFTAKKSEIKEIEELPFNDNIINQNNHFYEK